MKWLEELLQEEDTFTRAMVKRERLEETLALLDAYKKLEENVVKLKDMLGDEGDYAICKNAEGAKLQLGDMLIVSQVMEDIDTALSELKQEAK